MSKYCVVYTAFGIHFRYRCSAHNKREARRLCKEYMGCENKDITDVYKED